MSIFQIYLSGIIAAIIFSAITLVVDYHKEKKDGANEYTISGSDIGMFGVICIFSYAGCAFLICMMLNDFFSSDKPFIRIKIKKK